MQNSKRYFSILVICCFVFAGCHWLKSRKTPEEVVVAFCTAYCNLDFEEAVLYCDAETAVLMEALRAFSIGMSRENQMELKKTAKFIQSATCSINGDIALCRICCDENGLNASQEMTLRRQKDGRWLVFIEKEE